MKDVFIVSDNIISPLGTTTADNFSSLKEGFSGVRQHHDTAIADHSFYASLMNNNRLPGHETYTRFEQLLVDSASEALKDSNIAAADKKTIFIISSTKGNISLIENKTITPELKKQVALFTSAGRVGEYFNCSNKPLVISNACISGLLAILTGKRLIQSGQYDHAVVVGADIISKFIFSGFESFQAISNGPCRPFDERRNGINLGEGAGTIILSCDKKKSKGVKITGGAVSNDANHISGPSRTGEELCQAIKAAMRESKFTENDIDLVSAHGTATVYNDEMEALAISLANLQQVPVNSLKGYYGHTLGAAGIIESVASIQSLKQDLILPSMGFSRPGITKPLNVCTSLQATTLRNCLKTASGFGGCNAALIFSKD